MKMNESKIPLWKKSMLQNLNYCEILETLYEIGNNGDMYGYEWGWGVEGYYNEYKDNFDDLAAGAYYLEQAMRDSFGLKEIWDDITVGLLGYQQTVLGYGVFETDYCSMLNWEEDAAVEEAEKRLMRLTKKELIERFRRVFTTLILFFDVKASHDCLVSIVQELDERAAIMKEKDNQINRLYEDLTGKGAQEFDSLIETLPQRMWVE